MGPKLSDEDIIEDKFDDLFHLAENAQYDSDLDESDEYLYDTINLWDDDQS